MTDNPEFEEERGDPEADIGEHPPFPIGVFSEQTPGERFVPGSPRAEVITFTTFDARPLNAGDFRVFGGSLITAIDGFTPQVGFFNFQVPQGRVAILRGFDYSFDPIFNLTFVDEFKNFYLARVFAGARTDVDLFTAQITNTGTVQPGYSDLRLGQRCAMQPTYVIADEGLFISLVVQQLTPQTFLHTQFNVRFYGNLLLKTGRPDSFEPGTDTNLLRGLLGT